MNGAVIPLINNDVFLMGTGGTTNGTQLSANSKDFSHSHSVTTNVTIDAHSVTQPVVAAHSITQPTFTTSAHYHNTFSLTAGGQTYGTSNVPLASGSAAGQSYSGTAVVYNGLWDVPSTMSVQASYSGAVGFPNSGQGSSNGDHVDYVHISHTHGASTVTGTTNIAHTHSATSVTGTVGNQGGVSGDSDLDASQTTDVALSGHSLSQNVGVGNHTVTNNAVTSGSGLGSIDVRPKYISAKFIMRIK
jgi:hypothetical protein